MKYSRLVKSHNIVPYNELKDLFPSLTADQVVDWMVRRKLATKDTAKFAELLEKAIQKQERISIVYGAAEDNFVEERRTVSPLAFQVKKPKHENQEFIYVVCYNGEQKVRTYRFDRLKEVKTISLPRRVPEDGYSDYYTYFSDDIVPDYYEGLDNIPDFGGVLLSE